MRRAYISEGKGWLYGQPIILTTNVWKYALQYCRVCPSTPVYFTARGSRIFVRRF